MSKKKDMVKLSVTNYDHTTSWNMDDMFKHHKVVVDGWTSKVMYWKEDEPDFDEEEDYYLDLVVFVPRDKLEKVKRHLDNNPEWKWSTML